MHISSLPSNYGIGTFGEEAYKFIDFLVETRQQYWQVLPLGVTGYGNSPYQCLSAFAGNVNFIDLDILSQQNYLVKEQITQIDFGKDKRNVDYIKIYENRKKILQEATKNFLLENEEYKIFCKENSFWLDDFSLFMAIKEKNDMQSFDKWGKGLSLRKKEIMGKFLNENIDEIKFYKIIQFWFYEQYYKLKKYANKKGIKIIGDIPFYVAYDSSDVWANPKLFELDEKNIPKNVAGVPPDAFSDDGQLWGNPLYNYEEMRKDNYLWWKKRIENCLKQCDILRIDHFRAFDSYYAVPYGNKNAKIGEWRKGEGFNFFKKLDLLDKNIIAEDLGDINDSVRNLIKLVEYPNMKVLQFAFDSNRKNEFLVKNHNENCVVYTGTHDNNTTKGWYKRCSIKERINLIKFIPSSLFSTKSKALIQYAFTSKAKMIIIPMQDYLNLGEEARMNLPSTLNNNWEWRAIKEDFSENIIDYIKSFKK